MLTEGNTEKMCPDYKVRESACESERETHTIRESVREREADREGEGELIASVFQIKAQSI